MSQKMSLKFNDHNGANFAEIHIGELAFNLINHNSTRLEHTLDFIIGESIPKESFYRAILSASISEFKIKNECFLGISNVDAYWDDDSECVKGRVTPYVQPIGTGANGYIKKISYQAFILRNSD